MQKNYLDQKSSQHKEVTDIQGNFTYNDRNKETYTLGHSSTFSVIFLRNQKTSF